MCTTESCDVSVLLTTDVNTSPVNAAMTPDARALLITFI